MKRTAMCIVAIAILSITAMHGQTPERPNAIVGKVIWNDYHTPINGEFSKFGNYGTGFALSYVRHIGPYLNVGIPLQVAVIDLPSDVNMRTTIGFDAVGQLKLYKPENRITPYFTTGIGGVWEEFESLNFQVPIGIGANFHLGKYAFVNVEAQYRKSLSENRDNFQYGIGLGFLLGKIDEEDPKLIENFAADQDRDGVEDKDDKCPEIPGVAAFDGCPDTDLDGIVDSMDECPEVAGPRSTKGCPDTDGDGFADSKDECPDAIGSLNGCPDTDGDGLANKDDECPDRAGPKTNAGCPALDSDKDGFGDEVDECPTVQGTLRGCPDTDGDGIADKDDKCPNAKGPGRFDGCPDSDGDGIADKDDKCPNAAAPESPTGCPEIKVEDKAVLDYALQAVQFEFGSSVLKMESYPVLDQVLSVIQKYPEYLLSIIGHTDDVGNENRNQNLSVARAKSCYDYLITRGAPANSIIIGGYGESRPIADNATEEGRRLNRRVEFLVVPR